MSDEKNASKESWWKRTRPTASVLADIGTFGAFLGAIVALCYNTEANRESSRWQAQTAATGILQDYLKVAIDHPKLAEGSERRPITSEYSWLASHAYFSAEAIYNLTRGQPGWDSTVTAIVRYHHGLVRDSLYPCADYSAAFDSLVQRQLLAEYYCYHEAKRGPQQRSP